MNFLPWTGKVTSYTSHCRTLYQSPTLTFDVYHVKGNSNSQFSLIPLINPYY